MITLTDELIAAKLKHVQVSTIVSFYWNLLLPPSPNKSIPRIRVSQIFLSLTNFIEKSINIYETKWAPYENIFYDKSMILIWYHKS
jgi:hypothetical protein